MFSLYPKPNSYAIPNPIPAMSNCYIQACTKLPAGCSGISAVSRVRVRGKFTARN